MADNGSPEAQATSVALASARRIKEYEMRREGHHHEWILLTSRVTAYLTSQSLFATGAALLYANSKDTNNLNTAVLFLAIIGLCITVLSSLSICINLRVIHDWHIYINQLIAIDKEQKDGKKDDYLKGFYIDRIQPDRLHKISTNAFCIGITIIGGTSWLFVITKITINFISEKYDLPIIVSSTLISGIALYVWIVYLLKIYREWSLWGKSLPQAKVA